MTFCFRCVASNSEGSDSGVINLTGKTNNVPVLGKLKSSLKSYKLLIWLYTSQVLLPAFIFYPGSQSDY